MKKSDLRRRAEAHLSGQPSAASGPEGDTLRLLHELQVHQIELEMQNAELQECRNRAENMLDKYIDLFDFAPVGYFSLDQKGRIREVNLTGATLLGVERSRLVSRSLPRFAVAPDRPILATMLERVFAGDNNQPHEIEIRLKNEEGMQFWAGLIARPVLDADRQEKLCRIALTDVSLRKQAEEDRQHAAILALSNEELKQEILSRQVVEDALKTSEQQQRHLLAQSCHLQEELRAMSRNSMHTREEERKRISRDLHDDIAQTLVGINVQLEALGRMAEIAPKDLKQQIARTQALVQNSVEAVLQFALELRPASLEDLGLNASLKTLLNTFMKRSGIRTHLKTFTGADQLNGDQLTTLYRIAQTALANVAQHSRATRVELWIYKTPDAIHVQVSDNGIAFDVQKMSKHRVGRHLGLISMRERAEMMGGTFRIESEVGTGTTLHVQLPLTRATPAP